MTTLKKTNSCSKKIHILRKRSLKASQKDRSFCHWGHLEVSASPGLWTVQGTVAFSTLFGIFCEKWWLGCCYTASSSGTKPRWRSSCFFSPMCISFPPLQHIPAPQLDLPLASQFFLWHLCTPNCVNSVSQEHGGFILFLFGEKHWEEIFTFLGPREELYMMPEVSKRWADKECLKYWTSYSNCPSMLDKIKALKSLWTALHLCMGPSLPSPAVRWFPAQKGRCAPEAAGSSILWTNGPSVRDGMFCIAHSTEREHSLKGCKQSVPVMSSQLIDYWKYNWILCLGEI